MDQGCDCDVLVVGLGPVGAALSALLAQRGVSTIALERDTAVYPMPRAVHFDHEIMRLFQELGVADAVKQHTRDLPDYEFRTADGQLLMRLSPAPQTPSGWSSGYMFHQPGLEDALREKLARSPDADVRLGWRLEHFIETKDGVSATASCPDGLATIKARYLVGCDGAWSQVREAMGGGLFDYQFDEPWLVLDAKVTPESRLPEVNLQLCDPKRPTTCVMSGPGRHRWEFMLLPGETSAAMVADEAIQGLLQPWKCGPLEIERKAVYRFHGLVANRWRAGRIMIAGDAAPQTPPFAGQGMCSGLRDVANLAWKLDAVLKGEAGDGLLDTYQTEREPHVRSAIELAIGMGRLVCTLDPEVAAARDANMLAQQRSGAAPPPLPAMPFGEGCILRGSPGAGTIFPQPTSVQGGETLRLDDVLGAKAWLICRAPPMHSQGLQAYLLDNPALSPFRAALEAWLEKHQVQAVIVRPDRYIFGAGDSDSLVAAWSKILAPIGLPA